MTRFSEPMARLLRYLQLLTTNPFATWVQALTIQKKPTHCVGQPALWQLAFWHRLYRISSPRRYFSRYKACYPPLKTNVEKNYEATAHPKLVVAIGDSACSGFPYTTNYACLRPIHTFVDMEMMIRGNPPNAATLLNGFLACQQRLLS